MPVSGGDGFVLTDPFAGPFTPVNIRSQGLSALVIAVYGTFLAYHGIRSASPQRDRTVMTAQSSHMST
jgi:hypothetical protein